MSARDPGVLPGLLGWPEGESARALPPGASEVASSCSGGDRDGMRARAPGATAAGRERPWAGAALLWRRSPGSHLADSRRPVTLRRFESTSGGRRWGLGLGRSPCGTARRSPSLGTPRLWRESLGFPPFKNTSSSEQRAAFRIRGALSSSWFRHHYSPGRARRKGMAFWPGRRCFQDPRLCDNWTKIGGPDDKDGGGSVGNGVCKMVQSSILSFIFGRSCEIHDWLAG